MNNKFFAVSIDSLLKTFSVVDAGESVSFQVSPEDSPSIKANDCVIGFIGHGLDEFRMVFEVQDIEETTVTMVKKIERDDGVPCGDFVEAIIGQLAKLSSPGSIVELPDSIGREIRDRLYGKFVLNKGKPTAVDSVLQLITYGAPGTGKSYDVKKETRAWKDNVFRTTFHPDSDYSTFVGAYKPSMSENAGRVEVYKGVGESKVLDATHEVKKGISYDFIPQAFIKAYVLAWKKMSEAPNGDDGKPNPEPVFLVIEEINRGNCAQIFGDIFQLLDRNEAGYSDYPISADADLKKFLSRTQSEGGIGDIDAGVISTRYGVDKGEVELIRDGRHLMLPQNLLIRATMNTSDQSLFPIDSAFKRRWDWKYIPISKPDTAKDPAWKDRKIEVGDTLYDWWEFLQLINNHIYKATESEDKQLGYFFVKADSATGYISAEKFVNKVLFYLYGDVFRSYELPKKDCFGELKFKDFFFKGVDGGHLPGEVNTDKLKEFLDNLKWEGVGVKSEPISKAPKTEGE